MKPQKALNIRLPKEDWLFLKKKAINEDTSMNMLIIQWIKKLQKKEEKKALTKDDAKVQ